MAFQTEAFQTATQMVSAMKASVTLMDSAMKASAMVVSVTLMASKEFQQRKLSFVNSHVVTVAVKYHPFS
eukprot:3609-Heterococcus_DN1.PRE.1